MTRSDLPDDISSDLRSVKNGDLQVTVRRTERVQTREAWVGWTTVVANILLPLSILIAGWGVWEQTRQAKRDAASDTVNLFFDPGLVEAQTTLFSLWAEQDLSILEAPQSRAFINAFVERTIRMSEAPPQRISTAIVSIASYFDRVEACISNHRCDEEEVLNQIGSYGRDFHCIYAGEIKKIRNQTLIRFLGEGLQNFAARAGGCSNL